MADKKHLPRKAKKILISILIAIPLLLILFAIGAIAALFIQYSTVSYTPSQIVRRTDTYTLPAYPEIIPGSEGITDFPDVTDPPQTTAVPEVTTEDPAVTIAVPEETTVPPETTPETTAETEPVTAAPETTTSAPIPAPPVTTTPPETLPSVTYAPSTTQAPSSAPTTTAKTPTTTNNNSFATSPNAISVYGKVPIYEVEPIDSDVLNILVLGTDSRDVTQERGRSDTMIVVSYNKKDGTLKMVSFLRDALVPIENHDWNRINTAYAFGGVGLAINTVNQLFGLDIQHFVVVDFKGAQNFIDYVGGVDLTITAAEAEYLGKGFKAGPQHFDGRLAMIHMRNRTSDNDFGRTRRQRDVITALLKKILTEKNLTEIYDITTYAMGLVKTNIPATTLTSLAASVLAQAGTLSIETQNVPYSDAYQFGWYNRMAILSFDITGTAERLREFLYE